MRDMGPFFPLQDCAVRGRAASIRGPHPLKANGAPELLLSNFKMPSWGQFRLHQDSQVCGRGWA